MFAAVLTSCKYTYSCSYKIISSQIKLLYYYYYYYYYDYDYDYDYDHYYMYDYDHDHDHDHDHDYDCDYDHYYHQERRKLCKNNLLDKSKDIFSFIKICTNLPERIKS